MVKFISIVLGIALWSTSAIASTKPSDPSQYCFYAVYQSLSKFTWPTSTDSTLSLRSNIPISANLEIRATETKVATYCQNPVEVISLYASAKLYCSTEEFENGFLLWNRLCKAVDNTLMDLENITTTVTLAYAESLPIVDPESTGKNVTVPSVIVHSYFNRARRSYVCYFLLSSKEPPLMTWVARLRPEQTRFEGAGMGHHGLLGWSACPRHGSECSICDSCQLCHA